ncbi:hypothetical protein [Novacetimonas hansenii]|uniref:hypothetical protein n=1 Tax=Novacetimonas hansenii TaxID=436 RepID=UPI000A524D3E|nr:hypothetical protein [Novacetimonas hansenii]
MKKSKRINFSVLDALSQEIKEIAKCRTYPFALLYMHHQLLVGGSTRYFSIDKKILNYMISCLYIQRKVHKKVIYFDINEQVYVYNKLSCIRNIIGNFILEKNKEIFSTLFSEDTYPQFLTFDTDFVKIAAFLSAYISSPNDFLCLAEIRYKNFSSDIEKYFGFKIEECIKIIQIIRVLMKEKRCFGKDLRKQEDPLDQIRFNIDEIFRKSDCLLNKELIFNVLNFFVYNSKLDIEKVSLFGRIPSDVYPIFYEDDNKSYILFDEYNLCKSVYDTLGFALYRRMKKRYENRSGDNLENVVYSVLENIRHKSQIFLDKRIKIKKSKNDYTDIDVILSNSYVSIIFQCKTKTMTEDSILGDENKIREDYEESIGKASIQGEKCKEAILNKEKFTFFDEKENNISSKINSFCSKHCVIVTLLQENYPGRTIQSSMSFNEEKINHIVIDFPFLYKISKKINNLNIIIMYFDFRSKIAPFQCVFYSEENIFYYFYYEIYTRKRCSLRPVMNDFKNDILHNKIDEIIEYVQREIDFFSWGNTDHP